MTDEDGRVGEDLPPGYMVGMVVAVNHVFNFGIEAGSQFALEPLGKIRPQGVDDNDAFGRCQKDRVMGSRACLVEVARDIADGERRIG